MKRITLLWGALLALALALPAFAQVNQAQGKRSRKGGKIFKKMDKNNDQQISRDEWQRKPKAFDRIDQNNDGVLTDVELKEAQKRRRHSNNPTQPL